MSSQAWSPEQIAGYLKVSGQPTVSHKTIIHRPDNALASKKRLRSL